MASRAFVLVLIAVATPLAVHAAEQRLMATVSRGNPIRRVVKMLQAMQDKVNQEEKSEKALFDKYMCYCKSAGGELSGGIKVGNSKIESLTAAIKASKEKKVITEEDLKKHQTSRAEGKQALAEAAGVRDKEAAAFGAFEEDAKTNLASLGKAIPAIESGMGGAFIQTAAASKLRTFTMEKAELPDETRQEVLAFLSGRAAADDGYVPQSGQIVGILKQMEEEMSKSLDEATATEAAAVKSYDELVAAKTKEVDALTAIIEKEQMRIGDIGMELAMMENDLEDSQKSLGEDTKFLAELGTNCAKKEKEWQVVQDQRQEELVALSETIKILNDDDALEVFKKTLPSAASSLLQMQVSAASMRARAFTALRKAQSIHGHLPARPEINLIALALRGKKVGLEKVIAMVDKMLANLKKEQIDDDSKKAYCETQLELAEDKKGELQSSVSDSETAIDELEGSIEKLTEEITNLKKGIVELDKSVAEATQQRKAENAEYKELVSSDTQAKEILLFAKNRLNKFYAPKLYKPEDEASASFVQITAHMQQRQGVPPPPPPETFDAYTKKSGESMGVTQMIDLLVRDLDRELVEAKANEKDAQADYEKLMAEAGKKRADDSMALTDKAAAKSTSEDALEKEQDRKASASQDLMVALELIHSLHGECDFLLKYYDARADARSGEIDALGKAKAVINGADFALLQMGSSHRVFLHAHRA